MADDEKVKQKNMRVYHTSRLGVAMNYLAFLVLIIIGYALHTLGYSYVFVFSALFLAMIILILSELKVRLNKIILKEDHMIINSGLFSKRKITMNYRNIADVRVKQSLIQRFFNYGDMEIGVPGAFIHQDVRQEFKGKGDIKIHGMGYQQRGIKVDKIQRVNEIENTILSKISTHAAQGKDEK